MDRTEEADVEVVVAVASESSACQNQTLYASGRLLLLRSELNGTLLRAAAIVRHASSGRWSITLARQRQRH
jgi:hypothetical protein